MCRQGIHVASKSYLRNDLVSPTKTKQVLTILAAFKVIVAVSLRDLRSGSGTQADHSKNSSLYCNKPLVYSSVLPFCSL